MSNTLIRVGLAAFLLGAVGFAAVPYATSYVSQSAIVNAPLVSVTAPYNGSIEQASKAVTQPVAVGDTLFVIKNSTSQRSELRSLQVALNSLSGDISGIEKQKRDLLTLSETLVKRRDARVLSRQQWFVPRLAEADANIIRAKSNLAREQERADRVQAQSDRGIVPDREVNTATADLAAARADLLEMTAIFNRLKVEEGTLNAEMGVDLNSNALEQIEYRLDEISVRLADLDARLLGLQAHRAALKTQISSTSIDAMRQETFQPKAASAGIVWNTSPKAGASVYAGEQIAQVLDCSRRFLEVELPERHFEKVTTGTQAWVQFKGSKEKFSGNVIVAYGSGAKPNRAMEAASARLEASDGLRVLVGLPQVDISDDAVRRSFCDVGRSAEVNFELADESWISRVVSLFKSDDPASVAEDAVQPDPAKAMIGRK